MTRARDVAGYISNVNAAGKNLLINGSFDHWQRGVGRLFSSGGTYLADRWTGSELYQQAGHQRVALGYVNSELNSQYALRVTSSSVAESSGGTRMRTTQKVESINTYPLRGKKVTLSFWVRFSSATITSVANSTNSSYGGWSPVIGYYTASTDGAINSTPDDSQSFMTIPNGSFPTVWTKYTVTGTVPTNANNISAYFGFATLGNTTASGDAWFEIAQVQLETGSIATNFSRAGGNFGAELALCQRYYYKQLAGGSFSNFSLGMAINTTTCTMGFTPPVTMRVTPTVVEFASLRLHDTQTGYAVTGVTVNGALSCASQPTYDVSVASGLTQYRPYYISANSSGSAYIGFGAEL